MKKYGYCHGGRTCRSRATGNANAHESYMSFNFKRDNTLTEKAAEMVAREGMYPIGIFLGHQ